MSLDIILFILRVVAGLALFGFMMALFVIVWRDYRAVGQEIETRTKQRGRLIVLNSRGIGLREGMMFPLQPLTSLGRAPSNTIIINDSFASSEHALVTLRGGRWWLEDRGSSNGTLLNGYRIEEPVVVSTGDIIIVGQVELKIELD